MLGPELGLALGSPTGTDMLGPELGLALGSPTGTDMLVQT